MNTRIIGEMGYDVTEIRVMKIRAVEIRVTLRHGDFFFSRKKEKERKCYERKEKTRLPQPRGQLGRSSNCPNVL